MDKENNGLNLVFFPVFIIVLWLGGGAIVGHYGKIVPVNSHQLSDNVQIFYQQGKQGIVSVRATPNWSKKKGKVIYKILYPARYDKIKVLKGQQDITHFLGELDSKLWILPKRLSQVKTQLYSCDKVLSFNERTNFLHVEDEGKKWLATGVGQKIVSYRESLKAVNNIIIKVDDKFLVYSRSNKIHSLFDEIVSPAFTENFDIKQGYSRISNLIAVRKDGKWGAVDQLGREIVPCIADAHKFEEHKNATFLYLRKGEKWSFINNYTKAFEFEYDSLSVFQNKFGSKNILFTKGQQKGIMDLGGREIYTNQNVEITAIENGPGFVVSGKNKTEILDFTGKLFYETEEKYVKYIPQGSGLYVFEKEGKLILIDRQKNQLYEKPLDDIEPLDNYHLVITENGKKGAINMHGELKLPIAFDDINYSTRERKLIIKHSPLEYEFHSPPSGADTFKQHKLLKPLPEPLFTYVYNKSFYVPNKYYISAPKIMVNNNPYIGLVVSINKDASKAFESWMKKWDEIMVYDYKVENHSSLSESELLKKLKQTKANKFKLDVHKDTAFPFNFHGKRVPISSTGVLSRPLNVQYSSTSLNGTKVYKVSNDHILIFKIIKK